MSVTTNRHGIALLPKAKGKGKRAKKRQPVLTAPVGCEICWVMGVKLTRHHIIPRMCGGTSEPENIIHLCFECHRAVHQHVEAEERVKANPVFIGLIKTANTPKFAPLLYMEGR
jgi:5-methylcytosine-specific restriction endonuclease McrA